MEEKHVHTHSYEESKNHTHEFFKSSDEELIALLKYMISHNESHNVELEQLAHELCHEDKEKAYQIVQEAIELYAKGTSKLKEALKELEVK